MASMKPKKSSLPPPKRRPAVAVGSPRRNMSGAIVIAAVVGVVLVVGIIVALVVSGGGDDDTESDGTVPPFSEIVKPVTVEGDALAPFTQQMIEGDAADAALGELAPIVSGVDYAGTPVTIDGTANGPTMVVLLAHWCPHCNAEIPHLNEWRDAGDVPDDLEIVGVSTGIDPTRPNYPPDQWLADKDWQWPILADSDEGTAFEAFGGQYYPTVVMIGSDGRVLLRFSGEPSADQIDELVRGALSEDNA